MTPCKCKWVNDTICWTCAERIATHREWRDGLSEWEYTCPECHRNEYPEKYEITDSDVNPLNNKQMGH